MTVDAVDAASIEATIVMKAISSTTNDGGASLLGTLVDNMASSLLTYSSVSGTRDLIVGDSVRVASGHTAGGVTGAVYVFTGLSASDVALGSEDFSNGDRWTRLTAESASTFIPALGNLTGSDSVGVGGLVARNDVRGSVSANIDNATVSAAGDVTVTATENATLLADITAKVSSSGGSMFGEGTSLAVNGTIATNLVLSAASATLTRSEVTAGGGLGGDGGQHLGH